MPEEITSWNSRAPEKELPETRITKSPRIEYVNFFTMGTPIKSVIAFSDCKDPSAQPEVLKPHRLQAVKVCLCKCTGDAKGRHEESITYGANFRVLCKCLQENIPILSHASSISRPIRAA